MGPGQKLSRQVASYWLTYTVHHTHIPRFFAYRKGFCTQRSTVVIGIALESAAALAPVAAAQAKPLEAEFQEDADAEAVVAVLQ